MIGVIGTSIYFWSFLNGIGLSVSGTFALCLILAIAGVGAAAFAIIGIKISTRVGLVLEIISVTAVGIVLITVLVKNGFTGEVSQFTLKGLSFDGVTFGIVLAVLGFVGFESAASLGAEARDPHRAIPRAVLGSAVLVGILYVVAAYTMVVGLRHAGGADAEQRTDQRPGGPERAERHRLARRPRGHGVLLRGHHRLHQRLVPDPVHDG